MTAPPPPDCNALFQVPGMFKSSRAWQKHGFAVIGEGVESNIMVASHPTAPGHLFKKYSDDVSHKRQLENYRRRIDGADRVRALIAAQQLTSIVVPRKRLHELPATFRRKKVPGYVLVVDKVPLLSSADAKPRYERLSKEALRQLCVVLRAFPGLDSGTRNVGLTEAGQIAFIDTERADRRDPKDEPLRHIRKYLSADQRKRVDDFFAK